MKLKKLHIDKIGPFLNFAITFEEQVTAITGRNDTGKSALLRAIEIVCSRDDDTLTKEADVNFDHLMSASVDWKRDKELKASGTFTFRKEGVLTEASFVSYAAPEHRTSSKLSIPDEGGFTSHRAMEKMPVVINVNRAIETGVREVINLEKLNEAERKFVELAFGPTFDFAATLGWSNGQFQKSLAKAENKLNRRLIGMLPPDAALQFRITNSHDNRHELHLTVTDQDNCSTALGQRGSGVRKLVSLLGVLALEKKDGRTRILLLDEPENSLHADAQHFLRSLLESLARSENIQVIYVTHSPSMVNTMRPESVRLLTRKRLADTAKTVLLDEPFAANYTAVRSSLGISPADSLLYAPVTIVVSGKTEVCCLPLLLRRMEDANIDGFNDVSQLLSLSIFIEAGGDGNMANLFRIAEAQGSRVIAFCDGDTGNRWKLAMNRVALDRLVVLDDRSEFENLVSRDVYFASLRTLLVDDRVESSRFDLWCEESPSVSRLSFTKQLNRWLVQTLNLPTVDKLDVMLHAVKSAAVEEIQIESLGKLCELMRQSLRHGSSRHG
jgi:predicted ATPase